MIRVNFFKTKRLASSAIAFLLILSLLFSLTSCLNFEETLGGIDSKEQITKNAIALSDGDKTHEYSAYYLRDLGIRNFDLNKFALVEAYFQIYYNGELPTTPAHAKATAALFLENYYDTVDLSDRGAVTDALLNCYCYSSGDRYAFYRTAKEYEEYLSGLMGEDVVVGIGVKVLVDYKENTMVVGAIIQGSGAESAGILPGDYIVEADGVKIGTDGVDKVFSAITGEEGSTVVIRVNRDGEELEFNIIRSKIESVSVFEHIENRIGYIKIDDFNEKTLGQFKAAIDKMTPDVVDGVIFDLRNNTGGLYGTVIEMIDYIAPEGLPISSYTSNAETRSYKSDDGHSFTELPMVVLCNEYTASAGELFTAAIRDYANMGAIRGSVVGATTFGKGIMQSSVGLKDGSYLTLTIAFYNPPSGINYHGEGIIPSVITPLDATAEQEESAALKELNKLILDEPTPDL